MKLRRSLLILVLVCTTLSVSAQERSSFDDAVVRFRQGLFHEALPFFRAAAVESPKNGQAHHGIAMCLYLTKRNRESLQHFSASEKCPNPEAQFFTNHAVCLEVLSELDKALQLLEKAIALDEKFTNAWFNKARFCARLGRMEEAEQAAKRALQLNPKHQEAHYEMANIHAKRKDHASTIIWARKAVALDANDPAALYLLARTLIRQGKKKEGRELASKALDLRLKLNKRNRTAKKVQSYLTLAYQMLGKRDINGALEYLKQVLLLDRTNKQARSAVLSIADALEKADKSKQAGAVRALLR